MTRYSVQPRDQIFVKGYGFLSFAKNMGKNIGKNISKNLSGKYSQKLLDHAKRSATDAFKTSFKSIIQKTTELVIWVVIKSLTKLQKYPKIHSKIIQRQLQMSMIKKYLKIYNSRRKTINYWWTEIKIV